MPPAWESNVTLDIAANSASYFKHPCFVAEQEWRLVVSTLPGCRKVDFRSSSRTVVPFIKLPPTKQGLLPIKSVTIGPTLNQELSEHSVKALLLSQDYKRLYVDGVKASTLPLAIT